MYQRIPLVDPDRFLESLRPLLRVLASPLGALIWLVVVGQGLRVAVENAGALWDQTEGLLAPENWLLLKMAVAHSQRSAQSLAFRQREALLKTDQVLSEALTFAGRNEGV